MARHLQLVPDTPVSATDRQVQLGRIYDAVLGGILRYAREEDPDMTFDQASVLLADFPRFLMGLKYTVHGGGFVRAMPDVSGHPPRP